MIKIPKSNMPLDMVEIAISEFIKNDYVCFKIAAIALHLFIGQLNSALRNNMQPATYTLNTQDEGGMLTITVSRPCRPFRR